jgi:hypothetical protein
MLNPTETKLQAALKALEDIAVGNPDSGQPWSAAKAKEKAKIALMFMGHQIKQPQEKPRVGRSNHKPSASPRSLAGHKL